VAKAANRLRRVGTSVQPPPTARLTVIAQDPSVRVAGKILTAQIEIPAEKLEPGPTGYRVQVIDYDTTRDRFLAQNA
jgi:hypothetical protein